MKRQRRAPAAVSHTDRWLISYADFITLLFAFFVTMYAISTVDQKKLAKAVAAFHTAFADSQVSPGPTPLPSLPRPPAGPPGTPAEGTLGDLKARLATRLGPGLEHRVELNMDQRGLVVSVREAGSFSTGRAELVPEAQELFRQIALNLVDISNHVRVEGHTDDVPIHTVRYASNWELSTARATNVVAFFTEQVALPPDRLSAAGYAEFHPRVPNDSPDHRAENRRVDIVVLNSQTLSREEPLGIAGRVH
jgi:chemotaxis protein MotB